jgi:UMF1 family MFS transporter
MVRERAVPRTDVSARSFVAESAQRMWHTLKNIRAYRDFGWLMVCGFFYQGGIAVVIALAAIYAQQVMSFSMAQTMLLILLVNVTAAIGAFLFGYVQDALGHRATLAITIAGWIAMVLTAALSTGSVGFWIAANIAGVCMGSSQSAGRAMVGLFAPASRLAEFYALWNAAVWLSGVFGPVTYGLVTWMTDNNHRLAILVTGMYFVIGLLVLALVNVERGRLAAKAD